MASLRRNNSGVTLIEVFSYMALVVVLMAIALPHLDTRREKTNTAIQNFTNDLRWARSKAIINGTHYCVHQVNSNRYEVRRLVLNATGTSWILDKVIKSVTIPSHMSWYMQTDSGGHYKFNTRGMQVSFNDPNNPYPLGTWFWDTYGAGHQVTVWPSGQAHEDW